MAIAWWRWAIGVVWVRVLAVGLLNDGRLMQTLGTQGTWHREVHRVCLRRRLWGWGSVWRRGWAGGAGAGGGRKGSRRDYFE